MWGTIYGLPLSCPQGKEPHNRLRQNLRNLWTLRNFVRENYNHGIGMNDLIFGENFDGGNLDTLTPLTEKRFDFCVSG
ncbi:hypothetical protein NXY33_22540 [Bacteroides fragilis]|nr:hypothetical protein [Bacteroides fragilis]